MLFLPESIYRSRRRIVEDLDSGKLTPEQAYQRMLELDRDDGIALTELGGLRFEAGDAAGAQEYLWRAVDAHPTQGPPYMELARVLEKQPGQEAFGPALVELCMRKTLMNPELLEDADEDAALITMPGLEFLNGLNKVEKLQVLVEATARQRDQEPAEVASRLRKYRLIHKLQEDSDLDTGVVDEIIAEGPAAVPLLVGVLRDYAQDFIDDDDISPAENALALLGEMGGPAAIPYLVEFILLEDADLSGAASWAVGRVLDLHPREAAAALAKIASGLSAVDRMGVLQILLRRPYTDADGVILTALGENLNRVDKADCARLLPLLLTSSAIVLGKRGIELGRTLLRRNCHLVSKRVRSECEDLMAELTSGGLPELALPKPSPWTVYDICAGNAIWDDEEEEDDEEDLAPTPAVRPPLPGRNDPCWCGSGKKYKKCHLEADGKAADEGEFVPLRRRIGEFLTDVVPRRDLERARDEFHGDATSDGEEHELAALDWIIHDWIPPRWEHGVMSEFLERNGARLNARERAFVESSARSFISLYEIQEVEAGRGVKLNDLIAGGTLFVHDVRSSKTAVRGDALLARVVEAERGLELGGSGLRVPVTHIEQLREWLEADRSDSGLEWPEYLKRNVPRIRQECFAIVREWVDNLRLANRDGDEILFSKSVYRILDHQPLRTKLNASSDWRADGDGVHYTRLNGERTVLGHIRIEGDDLILESNSRRRQEEGKELLRGLAGAALEHRRDEFTTQKEIKRRAMSGTGKPPEG
jgi:hypothetical protein